MKKEDCKFHFEWDYLEWSNGCYPCWNNAQTDWNQTLVTKINQTSATIFQSSLIGGANKILINSKLLPLFETLEYYNPNDDRIPENSESTKTLSGRFVIDIDDTIEDNTIFLYNNITNEEILSKRHLDNVFLEISFDEYKKGLRGYVTIKNYE